MDIEAVFEFIANNPPSILLAGGILIFLLGISVSGFNPGQGDAMIKFAYVCIILGVILQVLWLILRER
jgi:hypothetical protein